MNVGFFVVDTGTVDSALGLSCGAILVRSVRESMPGVPVVQFTDASTPAVSGVDEVRRLPSEPMAMLRMKHHAQAEGEWLFVDSDVYIQRDVRGVFEQSFDVAITTRNWSHLKPAEGFAERMPYNVGVVFSRCRRFWQAVYDELGCRQAELQQWMGDQQVICDLVARQKFRFYFLKGSRYNFPPAMIDGPDTLTMLRKAHIVHYKGMGRKTMMLERGACASA